MSETSTATESNWIPCRARGKVIVEFHPDAQHAGELELVPGEQVIIQHKSGVWYRGYLKREPEQIGVFHSAFIQLDKSIRRRSISASMLPDVLATKYQIEKKMVQSLPQVYSKGFAGGVALPGLSNPLFRELAQQEADEDTCSEASSVHETEPAPKIASDHVLVSEIELLCREWNVEAESLLADGAFDDYMATLEKVGLVLDYRRQLQRKNMTAVELEKLRRDVVEVLESSRRGISGFMIPRNKQGQITDIHNTPVMELLDLHKDMFKSLGPEGNHHFVEKLKERKELLSGNEVEDEDNPNQPLIIDEVYHLLIDVKALAFSVGQPLELQFNIWDEELGFIYDPYCAMFNEQGMSLDLGLLGNLKVAFRDLTLSDLKRKLHLVIRVYRMGGLAFDDTPRPGLDYKRPVGCSVYSLSFLEGLSTRSVKEFCPPTNSLVLYQAKEENDFAHLHEMILKHSKDISPLPKAQGMALGFSLETGRFRGRLKKINAGREVNVAVCRKNYFDATLMNSYYESRNDFFVTLKSALVLQDKKRSQKNVRVEIQVLNSHGKTVENCISWCQVSGGDQKNRNSSYLSSVLYHCNQPVWEETLKINISSVLFDDCHLLINLWHTSSKPEKNAIFAYTFLPLSRDGQLIRNGEHSLQCYKPIKSAMDFRAYYLSRDLTPDIRKDEIALETRLISTTRSQKMEMQTLLHWQDYAPEELEKALSACMLIEAEEFAKFLRSSFDSIFEMFCQFHGSPKLHENLLALLTQCLLYNLDQLTFKFVKFQKLVDNYIESYFKNKSIYLVLLDVSIRLVESAQEAESAKYKMKTLMLLCKMAKYVFKLMVRSYHLSGEAETDVFKDNIFRLLGGLCSILKSTDEKKDIFVGCKGFLFRSFPAVFQELSGILDAQEMGQAGLDFMQTIYGINSPNLSMDKLICLNKVISGVVCSSATSRSIIEPLVVLILKKHLQGTSLDESYLSVASLKQILNIVQTSSLEGDSKELVDMGVQIGSFPSILWELVGLVETLQLNKLGKSRVIPVRNQITKLANIDLLQDSFTCLCCLLYLMEDGDLLALCQQLDASEQVKQVSRLLRVLHTVYVEPSLSMFPSVWIVMVSFKYTFSAKVLASLQYVFSECLIPSQTGGEKEQFDSHLWESLLALFIDVLAGSCELQRTSGMPQRFRDTTKDVLKVLAQLWDVLGDNQIHLCSYFILHALPELVVRCGSEASSQGMTCFLDLLHKNPKGVERYTFDVLYRLANQSHGNADNLYKVIDSALLQSEHGTFKTHLSKLYKLMSSLFTFPETELYEYERASIALDLMEYLDNRDTFEVDTYSQYVEYLTNLHESLGSYCEAGMTLCRLAEKMKWSTTKESVYERAIAFFENSQEWEKAISVFDILREYHQKSSFKYDKVAEILRKSSKLFENIMKVDRFYSVYFRVCFYGAGFDQMPKEIVYKGNKLEKNIDFVSRIKSKWPEAYILMSSDTPNDEEIASRGSIISVTTLLPSSLEEMDGRFPAQMGRHVPKNVANYFRWNNLKVFTYKKPVSRSKESKPQNEFKDLWVLQTFLVVADTFPAIRRTSPVVERREIWISPIQGAVLNITEKNRELEDKVERVIGNVSLDIGPLSMTLNGTIDAAVNGGTQKYIEAFLNEEFLSEFPEYENDQKLLKKALKEQLDLLRLGLEAFSQRCGNDLRGLFDHLNSNFVKMKSSTELVIKK